MPLSALVSPATLTVVPVWAMTPKAMVVPIVNYSNISPLYDIGQSNTADNGVTPFLSRLMAATASSLNILPMKAIVPLTNYWLEFPAPSLRCVTAPENITAVINRVADTAAPPLGGAGIPFWNISFLAFTPQRQMLFNSGVDYPEYTRFVDTCVAEQSAINGSNFICMGMAADTAETPPYIWVQADSDYYSCTLEDTFFNVTFNVSGNIQTIDHPYSFRYTGKALQPGFYVLGQVMTNWLSGVVWGFYHGLESVRTQILQTSLYAALKTTTNETSIGGIVASAIPPVEKALTRGLTMGQLIEELSRNLTLNLFSTDRTWSPQGANATVNIVENANIYAYNAENLAISYGRAIGATVIAVVIGVSALLVNGVSHGRSFSSIMCSTRDKALDDLTVGYSLAVEPLGEEVLATGLQFGLLKERDQRPTRRVGFGLPG